MKKLTILSLLLSLIFIGCDKDSAGNIDVPKDEMIKLTFVASEQNSIASFYCKTEERRKGEIDWGDGETTLMNDSIILYEHKYTKLDKEYFITISSNFPLSRFGNIDYYDIVSLRETKSGVFKDINIGKGTQINILELQTSTIENVYIDPSAQLLSVSILLNNDFDLSKINSDKINHIRFFIPKDIGDINLRNSQLNKIELYLNDDIIVNSINIESSQRLSSIGLRSGSSKQKTPRIEKVTLKNLTNLDHFNINNLSVGVLDVSDANAPMLIFIENASIESSLKFDKKVEKIYIGDLVMVQIPSIINQIKELDISLCESLTELVLAELPYLETIKTSEKNTYLTDVKINHLYRINTKLKELNFSNLPNLNSLRFGGKYKANALERLDISNSPKLKYLLMDGMNLTDITAKNNRSLSTVSLDNNNLPEDVLLNFINSLDNTPLQDNTKRVLAIFNNPGNTPKVREAGDKLTNWKIHYDVLDYE